MNGALISDRQPRKWVRTASFLYRHLVSPVLHSTQRTLTGATGACRFQPTCSEYAALAWHLHGPAKGGKLALRRILRCHPFARGGFDPVPAIRTSKASEPPLSDAEPGRSATSEASGHLS